jgi:hypothetical protein
MFELKKGVEIAVGHLGGRDGINGFLHPRPDRGAGLNLNRVRARLDPLVNVAVVEVFALEATLFAHAGTLQVLEASRVYDLAELSLEAALDESALARDEKGARQTRLGE